MKLSPEPALTLLHTCSHGTLATHSATLPGYPYATVVPYALDERHRPILCISALAEHTKNLLADPRVSLSIVQPGAEDVQSAPRLTLVADTRRIQPDSATRARYLRYHPDAAQLLSLDFSFFRLDPKRIRYIGGVGKMGWLEDSEWADLPTLPEDIEERFVREGQVALGPRVRLLGADCFGIDFELKGERHRQRFADAPLTPERFMAVAPRVAVELG